ncbi:hypothetical protein RHGRI_027956 [Rhododendron griersonianum]|uniref:Late embryogenesis abundant protein LEA-2 subgroup domain-containing protein n=1 Tax=Rhododendron griersonianum TaxID=479676 RepID=A0AAV6J0Z7_9ERIC|nr:hypothetical protein RHGRI_027956 [Rhododendron griersonianum]
MSQVLTKSPKHCAKKGLNIDYKHYKKLIYAFSTFFLSILSLIFLVWVILHPSKPHFSLKEVNINQLNISAPHNLVNSSIQLTLLSNNPNKKVGIYYENLQVYASYKGQQISVDTSLPPFYQEHEETNFLSADLVGNGMPVGPSLGYEVGRDKIAGKLVMSLKVSGRIRWKVGTWVSGQNRFDVNCVATVDFGSPVESSSLSTKQGTQCSTIV